MARPTEPSHTQLMLHVAQSYYEQGRTQEDIGRELHLTRWKVGRLLDEALPHRLLGRVRPARVRGEGLRGHDPHPASAHRQRQADLLPFRFVRFDWRSPSGAPTEGP